MNAGNPRRTRRNEQHIPVPEQLFGAVTVDDRAGIDLGCDFERDPAGEVGLDDAGDDIDRRPLRGQYEVNADRPRHGRQP